MAQASIPVDLFNPGQVFACLGFLEAADKLHGNARGGFSWHTGETTYFSLSANNDGNPFQTVLEWLASVQTISIAPEGAVLSTAAWNIPTTTLPADSAFPISLPDSAATLPVVLKGQCDERAVQLKVDHWGDTTIRDNAKFWAGSGGYPGAALFRDALDLVRNDLVGAADDPFSVAKPQSSSFRFDWRRDYIPLDLGFSPNEHSNLTMVGYPIVEMLASIGLTNARPKRTERSKLEYRYSVLGIATPDELYDPIFLRAALGGTAMYFPHRDFMMQLGWPGQENQARCITNVIEETEA